MNLFQRLFGKKLANATSKHDLEMYQAQLDMEALRLREGLKYHVAKNFLEVDVTGKGNSGYTMSNARVQMLSLGRNHICSNNTAEHHI